MIGSEGCVFLSKVDWPCLTTIDLYRNQIGSKGVKYLTKANWPLLKSIILGIFEMFRSEPDRR